MNRNNFQNPVRFFSPTVVVVVLILLWIKFTGSLSAQPPEQTPQQNAPANSPPAQVSSATTLPASMPTTASADPDLPHLLSAASHLQDASDFLQKAGTRNKGGYLEKARADMVQTLADMNDAIDYANAHPADLHQSPTTSPAQAAAGITLLHDGKSLSRTAPNMQSALDALQSAYDALQSTGAGGPSREKIMQGINHAASDTIAGIKISGENAIAR